MSIEKLEEMVNEYGREYINPIFVKQETANIFTMFLYELKDLRQELAKKEDAIDISNIKEVKRRNG